MKACFISDAEGALSSLPDCTTISVTASLVAGAIPEAALYIWDYRPDMELSSRIAQLPAAQHLVLAEPRWLEALAPLQSTACILLKPVTAFTLRAFVELASKTRQLREQADEADRLRTDRDSLLQYVLDVNLKLQQYDHERNNFLARALHDFRAPLTALHGYCGLIADGKLGEITTSQRALLERMRYSTKRLTRLAGGTLQLLSNGQLDRPPRPDTGDIEGALNNALHDVYPLLQDKGIEISVALEPAGGSLHFESEQIQQVFINLLENSSKFTPRRGRITVHGYSVHSDREGSGQSDCASACGKPVNAYRIDISDSGPGVPAELAEKIFEQYASYSGAADRSGGGLGLAICRAIVTAHGGKVWATPANTGACFSFVLPFSTPPACIRRRPITSQPEEVAC